MNNNNNNNKMNMMDLTILAGHKKKLHSNRGVRKKRHRRWTVQEVCNLMAGLLFMFAAQLITSSQQQPSQLFLPAATQRGPISLVPRVNQKRLEEEEVDGFIMQAQLQNSTSPYFTQGNPLLNTTTQVPSKNATQNATTFDQIKPSGPLIVQVPQTTTTTMTTMTTLQSNNDQEEDDSRIPIDANRQQFVTHDQLLITNASSIGDDGDNNEYRQAATETAQGPEGSADEQGVEVAGTTTNNRGQLQWQRAISKVSHIISSLLSDDVSAENNGDPSNNNTSNTSNNNGLSSLYFLSSGNGSASATTGSESDELPDAGRRFMEEPAGETVATTTTTTTTISPPKQVAQSAYDADKQQLHEPMQQQQQQQQQQAATKRVAGQSQALDQPLTSQDDDGDGEQQPKCNGYCTLPLFTMLCDSTYRSADCGSFQKCCIIHDKPTESTEQQLQQATTTSETSSDQQQQSQFIEQASRPQTASQVCRGACLPMYHSSLCMRPNEIQLDSPGCLPSFVCCFNPASRQQPDEDTNTNQILGGESPSNQPQQQETLASGPSDHMISHTSFHQEQRPQSSSSTPSDSSLAAALVPPPPPMAEQDPRQQQPADLQMLRQPFYSVWPTARPSALPQPTTKSSTISSGSSNSSPAANFMSQLYQIFKSTTSSSQANTGSQSGNNSRDKQQQVRQQRQPAMLMTHTQVTPPAAAQSVQSQASFLSHLFADPYQALASFAGSAPSSPRPSSPPPPTSSMIQQQQQQHAMMSANNYAPFIMDHPHQQPAAINANKNRYQAAFLVDQQQQQHPHQHLLNHPSVQQAGKFKGGIQQQQQQHQQMMVQPNESIQPIVGQLTPSDQELLYMQHQMYLQQQQQQQQQFNKQNGFSFAPNQKQQHRFHYPIVATAANDNAHQVTPTFASLANQKPQAQQQQQQQPTTTTTRQGTNPVAVVTKSNTSQMKVAQHQLPPPPPSSLTSPTAVTTTSKQVNKLDQSVPVYPVGRPVGQVRISPLPPPFEQKGFVGLPPARQQQQQHQSMKPLVSTNNEPVFHTHGQSSEQQQHPTRSGNQANNRIQTNNRVATTTSDSHTQTNNGGQQQHLTSHKAAPHGGDQLLSSSPGNGQPPLSSSSSNVNVLFSQAPAVDLQRVDSQQQPQTRRQNVAKPAATNYHQMEMQTRPGSSGVQRPTAQVANSDDTDGDPLIVPVDQPTVALTSADSLECPSAQCMAPSNCPHPNYLDVNLACASAGAVCCARVATQQVADHSSATTMTTTTDLDQLKRQHSSTPSVVVPAEAATGSGGQLDGNKLDFPATSGVDTGDDQMMTIPQTADLPAATTGDSSSKFSTETIGSDYGPSNGNQSSKSKFQTCGIPNSNSVAGGRRNSGQARGRVMGGSDARLGYWCWQAALMNNKNEYLCGGALIGTKWVLTAAHCVTQHLRNESQLFVRLGQHNLNSSSSAKGAKSIQVKTSYVHHNHNGVTLDNDVALLRLEESVELDGDYDSEQNICLVCLPERGSHMEPGKRCMVTGYGFENELGPAALRVRQTELPIVGDQECQKKTSAVLGKPFQLPASSFCAGGEQGQDACHGDGGSPLSCLVDGYYELTGIVSWGYKCGSKDLPGLYSKVSTFVGWINQIVSVNN